MLSSFKRLATKFNIWYDRQEESKRFILCLLFTFPALALISFGSTKPLFFVLGIFWAIILIIVRKVGKLEQKKNKFYVIGYRK